MIQDSIAILVDMKYDKRHGGLWDRGSADSYYNRGIFPHYYVSDTGRGEKITISNMTKDEIDAYLAGYAYNEELGDKKDYGLDEY